MNIQIFIANELAALLAAPIALVATFLVSEKYKGRTLIFGQAAAFVFALFGALWIWCHDDVVPLTMQTQVLPFQMDSISSCLLAGITFIAAVVVAFSDRYLLGDKTRLSFLRSLSFLSSCAALLSITDSLAVALVCWSSLSFCLWGIMRLQPDCEREARTVLLYHLSSDVALFIGIFLIACSSGITSFSEQMNASHLLYERTNSVAVSAAAFLMILAFSIKSALFPFHKWLLSTLSAPTPLSALLHAGVVNVSAVMAWRMMPFLQEHSYVLLLWGCWSAVSAVIGTLSMSAQPDVKRKLVYSTVGQMGFMSLQSATGVPAVAIFHLLAHGLFKCQMFLQSGSAVSESLTKRKFGYADNPRNNSTMVRNVFLVASAAIGFCLIVAFWDKWSLTSASTAIAAAALLTAAPALYRIDFRSMSLLCVSILVLALSASFGINQFEHLIPSVSSDHSALFTVFLIISMVLAMWLSVGRKSRAAKALYVHSLNGFYVSEFGLTEKTKRFSNPS